VHTGAVKNLFNLQVLQRQDVADHVENRIDSADFVKMDVVHRRPVHLRLGFGNFQEHGLGFVYHVRIQSGAVQNFFDIVQVAVLVVMRMSVARLRSMFSVMVVLPFVVFRQVNVKIGRLDAVLIHRPVYQRIFSQRQFGKFLFQIGKRNAGVQQGAQHMLPLMPANGSAYNAFTVVFPPFSPHVRAALHRSARPLSTHVVDDAGQASLRQSHCRY
jgi:hypothetical protein